MPTGRMVRPGRKRPAGKALLGYANAPGITPSDQAAADLLADVLARQRDLQRAATPLEPVECHVLVDQLRIDLFRLPVLQQLHRAEQGIAQRLSFESRGGRGG